MSTCPTSPPEAQQAALEEVMAHEGEAFDTAWIASQIEGHRMTLAAGQEEIENGSEESVIALAEASAPVVQRHLDHLLEMSGSAPGAVPSGLGDAGSSPLLGVGVVALGLLALAGSVVLVRRRADVRA